MAARRIIVLDTIVSGTGNSLLNRVEQLVSIHHGPYHPLDEATGGVEDRSSQSTRLISPQRGWNQTHWYKTIQKVVTRANPNPNSSLIPLHFSQCR